MAFQRSPLAYLSELVEEYGDIVSVDLVGMPFMLINHPDDVDHILKRHQRNYDRGGRTYTLARALFGNGLFMAARPGWLRQRRLLQPAFHRQRIATFGELMTDTIKSVLDSWHQVSVGGANLDVRAEMSRLALRIVVRALFDMDPADAMARRFTDAVATSTREMSAYVQFPLVPLSVPTPGHRRFHRAQRVLDEVTYEIIRRHRQDEHDRGSLLAMMMRAQDADTGVGMTDTELRDEVFAMLFAGHETTASTLTWVWYLIGRHPAVEQRLRAEIDQVLGGRRPTMDDLPWLVHTRHVIEETLRLYPPAWQIFRQAGEDDEIGGYPIPAGTNVLWCSYLMHRHKQYWDDPERFDLDRFNELDNGRGDPAGYYPFGAGPRLCIGNTFAMAEMQFAIAMILQRHRLVPISGKSIEPSALLTLVAARPLVVRLDRLVGS
ncbi:cytochrome P450 [Nocardia sp. KC 131]|uniref:cytochrome P450 n=1 Tax=Nocardia arseniciresistens TaxID=3392119 RepID=UPI00398E68BC